MTNKTDLNIRITFFTEEDRKKAEELAKKSGLKLTAWVRNVIYRHLN